jgi:hypothetical protein
MLLPQWTIILLMSFSVAKTLHIATLLIPFISIITILVIPILVGLSILIMSKPLIISPTFVSFLFDYLAIFDLPFFGCHMMDNCLTTNNFVLVYFFWLVLQVVPHWQVCPSLHIALLVLSIGNHSLHALPFCRGCKFYVKFFILLSIGLHYDIFD